MRLAPIVALASAGCANLIIPANWRWEPPPSLVERAGEDFACDPTAIKVERMDSSIDLLASGCARRAVYTRRCRFESPQCWKIDQTM
jgi:hypothetical protein